MAGLAATFGSGAMTNPISDVAGARCLFVIGSNTTQAHPIVAHEIREAVRRGAALIVANPKRIDLARHASIFLQIKPGTDAALILGMMRVIADEGLKDTDFINRRCEGYEKLAESLAAFSLEEAARITGVPGRQIADAARLYASMKPASILYAMGVTQHTCGTDNVLALSDLALLTGNVGKPSSGVNPLRGQNNVQGACDMGALPNVLPGYRRVDDPEARRIFEAAWECDMPGKPGLTHAEIFDAALAGKIKAMYVIGENPVLSEADANHAKKALESLEFLVVQDLTITETAKLAHLVLPAAANAERDGTFTNTERRIQRIRAAVPPQGQAKPDWRITCMIAEKLGGRGFGYGEAREIFDEAASLIPAYAGVSYERLEAGGIQWPCPAKDHPGTPILHVERFSRPNGKAAFAAVRYRPPAETPDSEYPLVLTTDRSIFHFHTGTMTRKSDGLNLLGREEAVVMNPADAARIPAADGEMVRVSSRRGEVQARVKLSDTCPAGLVSMTFHFAEAPTNVLTNSALDPVAKIPETKVCAVRVERTQPGRAGT